MTDEMEYRETVAEPDDRSRVFDALTVGQGWMFLSVIVEGDGEGFGIKPETGGLVQGIEDIRTLLTKLLVSLPGQAQFLIDREGDTWRPAPDRPGLYGIIDGDMSVGFLLTRDTIERLYGPVREVAEP